MGRQSVWVLWVNYTRLFRYHQIFCVVNASLFEHQCDLETLETTLTVSFLALDYLHAAA